MSRDALEMGRNAGNGPTWGAAPPPVFLIEEPDPVAIPPPAGAWPGAYRPSPVGRPRAAAAGPSWEWARGLLLIGTVAPRQMSTFCRQFSTYLGAGVNLIRALDNLRRQFAWTSSGRRSTGSRRRCAGASRSATRWRASRGSSTASS